MVFLRKMVLFSALFVAITLLFTTVCVAEYGSDMDMSLSSMGSNSENYEFLMVRVVTPDSVEITVGDSVTWRNLQRPKMPIVLVSDDDLWDDHTIYYGKIFSYTFDEPGIYTFSVQDNPVMSGTIVVSDKSLHSVAEVSDEGTTTVSGPEAMPVMTQPRERDQAMMHEQVMDRSNEFLVIRTVTPTSMEIYAGEVVTWKNLQRPKMPIVLISDDGLWDDHTIYYGRIFSYTFDELGTYAFSVKDRPEMTGIIVVSEERMASVGDKETDDVMVAPTPAMMKEGEDVGSMDQVRERESMMERNYEFLIIRVATPESMEIEEGDTVIWRNLQRPKKPIVLVSDDGLWDDQTIYYGKMFSYTFEEAGTYNFSVRDNPAITGTIVVG